MKVTVCEIDPANDLEAQPEALTIHVVANASDFVLLPEMGFSPWLAATREVEPELWEEATRLHTHHIDSMTRLQVAAVAGTRPTINASGSRRNEAYVWSEDFGAKGVHDKVYLPDEPGYWEHTWYDRGPHVFDTARVDSARVGFQVCTEMWFFEWARHYARSRVDLLCVPRATPRSSIDKWVAGGQAAAVCSGAYCLSSNQRSLGTSALDHGGVGWIIDPEGNVLATTSEDEPFATVEVDLRFAQASKSEYPRYVAE